MSYLYVLRIFYTERNSVLASPIIGTDKRNLSVSIWNWSSFIWTIQNTSKLGYFSENWDDFSKENIPDGFDCSHSKMEFWSAVGAIIIQMLVNLQTSLVLDSIIRPWVKIFPIKIDDFCRILQKRTISLILVIREQNV